MSLEELDLSPGQVFLFSATFLLALAALGLRMSGYINKVAGLTIFWLSVTGMVAVALWWSWPLSRLEFWVILGVAAAAVILTAAARWNRKPRRQGDEGLVPLVGYVSPDDIPWREADGLLRRYSELEVDSTKGLPGVYRLDNAWDLAFHRFTEAFDRLEHAAERASFPYYDEYLEVCGEIREILSQPVPSPPGKGYYLELRKSHAIERLRRLVERDKTALYPGAGT